MDQGGSDRGALECPSRVPLDRPPVVVPYHPKGATKLTIRLNARKLTHHTIGHELTRLVRGLSPTTRSDHCLATVKKIPGGEKPGDIWTLARGSFFCDDSPHYLQVPRAVREHWPRCARAVRKLGIMAIVKRRIHRFYIRRLEAQIKQLTRAPYPKTF